MHELMALLRVRSSYTLLLLMLSSVVLYTLLSLVLGHA